MQPVKNYRQVPRFNLIPLEYRGATMSSPWLWLRVLLIVVIFAGVLVSLSFYRAKSTSAVATNTTRQKLQQIEEKVAVVNAEEVLKQERQTQVNSWQKIDASQTDWPQVMTAILLRKPQGVNISTVKQEGTGLNVTGSAENYSSLLRYRQTLLSSPAVAQLISLQSERGESSVSFSMALRVKVGGK